VNTNQSPSGFTTVLRDFFCQRLIAQRNASSRTIASYRDTFRLLFRYLQEQLKKEPATLQVTDLNAGMILQFLDYLEEKRRNTERSRNLRLAAIRSFMRYASHRMPDSLATIQEVLAIPGKRFDRPILGYLSREEMEGIIAAPDSKTFSGHRDSVMFLTLYNTGARVSEITALRVNDICRQGETSLLINGKGRKQRTVPLWKNTTKQLDRWLERSSPASTAPVFANRSGSPLSRSGVEYRLRLAVKKASEHFPALEKRRISPHTIRHTTAMHLLQAGVDITVIALWLGHESPTTTHQYIEADLAMKEAALKKLQDPTMKSVRYQAGDAVLSFLDSL